MFAAPHVLIESAGIFVRDQSITSFALAGSTPRNILPAGDYPSACEEVCVGLEEDVTACSSTDCTCSAVGASGQEYVPMSLTLPTATETSQR